MPLKGKFPTTERRSALSQALNSLSSLTMKGQNRSQTAIAKKSCSIAPFCTFAQIEHSQNKKSLPQKPFPKMNNHSSFSAPSALIHLLKCLLEHESRKALSSRKFFIYMHLRNAQNTLDRHLGDTFYIQSIRCLLISLSHSLREV